MADDYNQGGADALCTVRPAESEFPLHDGQTHAGAGEVTGALSTEVAEDVVRRLRHQAARLLAAGDVCFDAFVILDQDGRVAATNRRFTDFFGIAPNAVRSASRTG